MHPPIPLPVQNGTTLTFDVSESDFLSEIGMDQAEALMMQGRPVDCPVDHGWFPGLYVRTITMPKGAVVASKIHRTEHPFVILAGDVSVWNEATKTVMRFGTGYQGRTTPGTRRLLVCHEETVWATFHVRDDNETTVEQIEQRIIEPHYNPIVGMTHAEMAKIPSRHETHVLSIE